MSLTITGTEALLRWSYHQAAVLRSWTISRDEAGVLHLTASIVSGDTYRLSQQPLVFVVIHPHGSWRWPVTELQTEGASLSAVLGPKES